MDFDFWIWDLSFYRGQGKLLPVFLFLKKFADSISKYNIPRLLLLLVVVAVFGTSGILLFERENESFSTLRDGLWWLFVTITTVGYGDKFPVTTGGMIVGVVVMIVGIGFLGLFTATIASIFVEGAIKEGRGLGKMKTKNHIIICGWNQKARDIIAEFQLTKATDTGAIVIIANLENKPVEDRNIHFINGDPSNEDDLKRAGIETAQAAIILAERDLMGNEENADAKSILTGLTIKSLNPKVYVCLELLDPANRRHCELAKVDEVLVSGEMTSRLLSRAALEHGITQFFSELITSEYGNEVYKAEIPDEYLGKSFDELLTKLRAEHQAILVGYQRDGRIVTNPKENHVFERGDNIVVLSPQVLNLK